MVFYLHGNTGNLSPWGNISKVYTDLGYDIFILDYRGFGKSEGKIKNESQVNSDVLLAYRQMCLRYSEQKIIIAGYSIGSGPATILASKTHSKTLILQAPYYSFLELTSLKAPYFPHFLMKFSFETHLYIPKTKSPIYIFDGKNDNVIDFENSVRLSKILKPYDKFYELSTEDHLGINENRLFTDKLGELLK